MPIAEQIKLEVRLLGDVDMRKVSQPDGMMISKDSVWVCAFDEQGNLRARIGLAPIPVIAGVLVDGLEDSDQVIKDMIAKMEQYVSSGVKSKQAYTIITPAGGSTLAEEAGWEDTGLRVYRKDLGGNHAA